MTEREEQIIAQGVIFWEANVKRRRQALERAVADLAASQERLDYWLQHASRVKV